MCPPQESHPLKGTFSLQNVWPYKRANYYASNDRIILFHFHNRTLNQRTDEISQNKLLNKK